MGEDRVTPESGPVRELFADDLEVACWLDFGDSVNLGKAARLVWAQLGGTSTGYPEPPEPEEGRRLYALTWPAGPEQIAAAAADVAEVPENGAADYFAELEPEDGRDDSRALAWTNAYLLGVLRAASILAHLEAEGVHGTVAGVRVQRAGIVWPSSYQYAPPSELAPGAREEGARG